MKGIEALRQFQAGITGVIGFAGVMLTMWWNARLARNARDAAIRHERETLSIALIEELKVLRDSYVNNAETAGKARLDEGALDVPMFQMTDVYDKMLDKLGLLSSDQVAAVMNAYLTHRQVSYSISSVLGGVRGPSTTGVRIPVKNAKVLKALYEKRVPDFERAIRALGGSWTTVEAPVVTESKEGRGPA